MTQILRRRAVLLGPVLLGFTARPAGAHAVLVSSQPPANALIPAGPTKFLLRFNTRVDQARSRLILLGTDGLQTTLSIYPAGEQDELSSTGIVAPGGQALRWQVLAADGHISRGEIPFKAIRS